MATETIEMKEDRKAKQPSKTSDIPKNGHKVLIIEDEQPLVEALVYNLEKE